MRSTDGEALKEVESKTTHRHCTTWEGMRLEYLGGMTIPKLDKDGGQVEEPRGETPERKTGPARCRGIDAYGYPENGV